jgi:hypothetical protein
MTKRICLSAALVALTACRSSSPRAAEVGADSAPAGTRIALLYSSNLFGEYEPCG